MKIAIDIRTAGGEKAGKGWYTFHIVQNLLKMDDTNQYILYTRDKIVGFDHFKNAQIKLIKGNGLSWHRRVAKDVKKADIDIFFAPSSYIIPALLPKEIKTIVVVHDLVAFLFPNTHNKKAVFIEKIFIKKALKKADHIFTVSNNTKKDIFHQFNLDKNKITTAYCSASDNFKPIERAKLGEFIKETNLPTKFFLAVGTIIPRKNYLNLIKAFAEVNKRYPDYHLIIGGKNGWEFEEVYEEISKNYLNKKVHVLGYLSTSSLINLYNLAKAFVFPSFYEGFGIPPLEAMKCGCPVIASFTSSIPEVVGDSALLINPESVEEMANAMIKVIKDEELCTKLRSNGFNQSKKFSWEESAEKILEVIRTMN